MSSVKYILALGVDVVITMLSGCPSGKTLSSQNNQLESSSKKAWFFAVDSNKKQNKNSFNKDIAVVKNMPFVMGISAPKITSFQYAGLTIQAQECLQKYYVGYKYVLCLLYNGSDISVAASYLSSFFDGNSGNKLASQLLKKITNPLEYIIKKAQLFKVNIAQVSANFLNKTCSAQFSKKNNSLPVLGAVQRNIISKFFFK